MKENEIIEYWEKNKIREKALKMNSGKKRFYFLDGPPYATGNIHMGTAFNKILKDYYMRYFRMRGYDVWSQPGYDCHGLPIENKVEKQLGFKDKRDIEKFGIKNFIDECRKYATKYIDVMSDQFNNLGVWMNWENPYLTLKNGYMEGAWYTFKQAYEKGLLYKGKYAVHCCPHCETVVAYNEILYENVDDIAIYLKFKLRNKPNDYLLIWTTTPWTLPANTAVMVHPEYDYAKIETQRGNLWIAKELIQTVMEKLEMGYKILETMKGKQMKDWEYEHPLDLPCQKNVRGRIVLSDRYVTLDAGTGLVHTAPGHGQEDFEVGMQNNLPILSPIELNGKFTDDAGKYKGKFVKDADKEILEDLKKAGALLLEEKISHDYPHCWRCTSPLLFIAVPQWFFRIKEIKQRLIEQNKKVNWVPEWAGKRFENWLESLGDWPISRQRYWGIPLPIWTCECGEIKIIGSVKELGKELDELHKPDIDEVTFSCQKCGKSMKRVPDVLDVWFDAGVAPWASLDYPKNKEPFKSMWPVKFVLEGTDQTRGWWNSLTICGYITFDRIPFENVLQHGLILAEAGVKMSKSKENVIEPDEVIEKYGRDVLRFHLLLYDPSLDFDFSWKKADDVKRFFNTLQNCFRFFQLYCKKEDASELLLEDKWIISRINSVQKQADQYNSSFQAYKAIQLIEDFVLNDLSRWYIKLIRDRTWPTYEGKDKKAANATLYYVLDRLNLLLSPTIPYLTEGNNLEIFKDESVHLRLFPPIDNIDEKLEKDMLLVREIFEACSNVRQRMNLKLRWPIKQMSILSDDKNILDSARNVQEILCKICNVQEILFNKKIDGESVQFSKGKIILSKETMLEEALAKELIRNIQSLRKQKSLNVLEKIVLNVSSDEEMNQVLLKIRDIVSKKVNASKYMIGKQGQYSGVLEFQGKSITFAFSKE